MSLVCSEIVRRARASPDLNYQQPHWHNTSGGSEQAGNFFLQVLVNRTCWQTNYIWLGLSGGLRTNQSGGSWLLAGWPLHRLCCFNPLTLSEALWEEASNFTIQHWLPDRLGSRWAGVAWGGQPLIDLHKTAQCNVTLAAGWDNGLPSAYIDLPP